MLPALLNDLTFSKFEADSEDDDMENEIDNNLDQLHGAAKRKSLLSLFLSLLFSPPLSLFHSCSPTLWCSYFHPIHTLSPLILLIHISICPDKPH